MKKLIVILFLFMFISTAYGEVMIVSNKTVPNSSISKQDIKDIFLGKKLYWEDNTRIIVATMTQSEANTTFLKTYLNQTAKQYDSYWEKKLFTGDKNAPKRFKTPKLMLEYIASTPGSIGFLDSTTPPQNVKIHVVE